MAKLIYTMSPWEWVCSECGETYSRVDISKVWGGMRASINKVENPENKDKFIGGFCKSCKCHWDSWEINNMPESWKKCNDTKCPENYHGYCSIGGQPVYLLVIKNKEIEPVKNNP